MPDYKMRKMKDIPYLYVERSCSMNPSDISKNMGAAFCTVAEFIGTHGISSIGNALSVYYEYDEKTMKFRAGFIVSSTDAEKAEGEVRGDVLPSGEVLNFIHKGPYAKLRDSYADMMKYLAANSLVVSAPTVEVYLNNPNMVASEDELETDIYVTVAAA